MRPGIYGHACANHPSGSQPGSIDQAARTIPSETQIELDHQIIQMERTEVYTAPRRAHQVTTYGRGAVGWLQLSTDHINLRINKLAMKQLL
jgi:hypothetical protein